MTRPDGDSARGEAEVLLCNDAAAEGLNFQFCGALINYDMPWNPMRVEQRIGRIDRLGQEHGDHPHRQPALRRHDRDGRIPGPPRPHRVVPVSGWPLAADPGAASAYHHCGGACRQRP